MQQAERLCGLPTGAVGPLSDVASTGRAVSGALTRAADELIGFELPPILGLAGADRSLLLRVDPPVGARAQGAYGSVGAIGLGEHIASPREALILDVPAGAVVDTKVARQARVEGISYREAQLQSQLADLEHDKTIHGSEARLRIQQQLAAIDPLHKGDLGGTLDSEVRFPYPELHGASGARGRDLILRALGDTADEERIRIDEFGAVLHDDGKVTLVLPGVTDLSSFVSLSPPGLPGLGLDPGSRTARDLDRNALPSSFSSEIEDNSYAQLVAEWVETQVEAGVIKRGAETLIVGHSYGADTALDLASSEVVNGDLLTITHVVPMAYHSEPQFEHVVAGTKVLAIQNIYDVPVIVEGVAAGDVIDGVGRLGVEVVEETAEFATEGAIQVGGSLVGAVPFGPFAPLKQVLGNLDVDVEFEFAGDRVAQINDDQLLVEFEGRFDGFGHAQQNYETYIVNSAGVPEVDEFFSQVGSSFPAAGAMLGVDISEPEEAPQTPSVERSHLPSEPVAIPEPITLEESLESIVEPLAPVFDPFEPIFGPVIAPVVPRPPTPSLTPNVVPTPDPVHGPR